MHRSEDAAASYKAIGLLTALCFGTSGPSEEGRPMGSFSKPETSEIPQTFLFDRTRLAASRAGFQRGGSDEGQAVTSLAKTAFLRYSAMRSSLSGEGSEATLPRSEGSLESRLTSICEAILLLGLAAYLTDKVEALEEAVSLLEDHLLDPNIWSDLADIGNGNLSSFYAPFPGRVVIYALEGAQLLVATGKLSRERKSTLQTLFEQWRAKLESLAVAGHGSNLGPAGNQDSFWIRLGTLVYASFSQPSDAFQSDILTQVVAGGEATDLASIDDYENVSTRVSEGPVIAIMDAGLRFQVIRRHLIVNQARQAVGPSGAATPSSSDGAGPSDQQSELLALRTERDQWRIHAEDLRRRYVALVGSRSWRMLAPAQEVARLVKRAATGRPSPRTILPPPPLAGTTQDTLPKGRVSRWIDAHSPFSQRDHLATLRGAQPANEEALRTAYQHSPLAQAPDDFVLYRIVGNDLYPRHRRGQSRENVTFLLENEPVLEGCEKRWILNRIHDAEEERHIIELMEKHNQSFLRIPFDPAEYRKIGLDWEAMPLPDYFNSSAFQQLEEEKRDRARVALYRLKNNYVMNNNGARNLALQDGRTRAKWVLPWDGNCFVTKSAWAEICEAVAARPYLKYFVVPMERIIDNAQLLGDDFVHNPLEEPQILFRSDASEEFNERFSYGRRSKVELFWRLGVPGAWDGWMDDPWDQPRLALSSEAHQFGVAGWVARMFSGVSQLEKVGSASRRNRYLARMDAVVSTLDTLDEKLGISPEHDGIL